MNQFVFKPSFSFTSIFMYSKSRPKVHAAAGFTTTALALSHMS